MTKQERIAYDKKQAYTLELENEVHKLRCQVGDYADAVQELAFCLEHKENTYQAQLTLVSIYKRHKENYYVHSYHSAI